MSPPKIHAVCVTYNTSESFVELLECLVPQVSTISLVDNSTEAQPQTFLFELSQHYATVSYTGGGENLGLAKAQNIGIQEALDHQADWVLLLDDDSMVAADMVEKQVAVLTGDSDRESLAIIAPRMINAEASQSERYLCKGGLLGVMSKQIDGEALLDAYVVVASGSLINISVLQALGFMEEKLFIDEIDTEFCLRCVHAGYRVVVAPKARLYHKIGEGEEHSVGFRNVTTWNHSPQRKYYIYRNRLWLWKNYLLKTPAFVLYEIISTLKLTTLIILFEKERPVKIGAILKGLWSGLWL